MVNDETYSIKKYIDQVEGWLSEKEGNFLYETAKIVPTNGVIVEIGSWKGKSTICLGLGSKAGNHVRIYAIDPHTGSYQHKELNEKWTFEAFKENVKNACVDDVIIPLTKTSEEASKNWYMPITFLFIDGNHEPEAVEKDFLLWSRHLINGGIVALHDTTYRSRILPGYPGPKRVAERFILNSENFKNVGLVDTITYGKKCTINSSSDKIKKIYIKFRKSITDFLSQLYWKAVKLPTPIQHIIKKIMFLKS